MKQNKPSEILKYFFRYAIISAARYANTRDQLQESIATTFSMSMPIIDRMSRNNKETITLFNVMLNSVCKVTKQKSINIAKGLEISKVLFDGIDVRRMIEALNMLPDFERQLIVLHDIEMFSNKEIAELYSFKIKNTCTLMHCLKQKLTDIYASLWPFAKDDDIAGTCEALLNVRDYIDQVLFVKIVLSMEDIAINN